MRRIGTMLSVLVAMLAMSGLAHALGGSSASTDVTSTTFEATSTTINAESTTVTLPDRTDSETRTSVVMSTTLAEATPVSAAVEHTIDVLDAGRVSLEVGSDSLVLLEAVAADGWTITSQKQEPAEVEVSFTDGSTLVEFEAEVEDDGLEVKIETLQVPAPIAASGESKTYQVGDAGTVTILVGEPLELVDVQVSEGWTFEVEVSEDGIEVEFSNGGMEAEFEAEWDEDQLEIEVDTSDSGQEDDDEDDDEEEEEEDEEDDDDEDDDEDDDD